MLRSVVRILDRTIQATDGEIGRCHDFLFDDSTWKIRYMVAKTAKWLPGRKVIISPVFLNELDWAADKLPVRLSREQIKKSPSLDEYAPVSRQYEIIYHEYFALPFYWTGEERGKTYPSTLGVVYPVPDEAPPPPADTEAAENHLRSVKEITAYHIAATDGAIGHIEDFLFDDDSWVVRYMVVDTGNWLSRRKVLVAPAWIDSIDWVNEKVHVELSTDAVKQSPEFDPAQPIERDYEELLHKHYNQPYYWE